MTLLPIVERELRARSRLKSSYWLRSGVVLVGLLICLPQLTTNSGPLSPSQIGRGIFYSVIIAAFALCCCACCLTIDSFSSEHREGTLGLLLLTRVRVLDVVLGKMASVGLTSLGALVTFSPFLMLPLLAGGVTGPEAFRQLLVLLNVLFFALAAGVWSGAAEENFSRAVRRAAALLLFVFLLPWCIREWMSPSSVLGFFSPLVAANAATDSNYTRGQSSDFWCSLTVFHLAGWVVLGGSVYRLRVAFSAQRIGTARGNSLPLLENIPTSGQKRFSERKEREPVEWLSAKEKGVKAALWAAAVLQVLTQSVLLLPFARFGARMALGFYVPSLALSLLSAALIAWAASRFLAEANRTGQLELLLTTPGGAAKIIAAQWKTLKKYLIGPITVMLAPALIQTIRFYVQFALISGLSAFYSPVWMLLSLVNTFVSVGALCWLAMFFAIRTRSQAGGVIWAVALARGVPYVINTFCYSLLVPLFQGMARPTYFSWVYLLVPMLSAAALTCLMLWARQALLASLSDRMESVGAKDVLLRTGQSIDRAIRAFRHWTPQ